MKSKVGTVQSIHSDNIDGALNDELVVAGRVNIWKEL